MAAVKSEKGYGWDVQCAYCSSSESEMNNPRKLPCGHVNCLKGIQDDFEASKILQCTKCSQAFDMIPEELDVQYLGEGIISECFCEVCQDERQAAEVYCPTCPKKMCKMHEEQHTHWCPTHMNVMSIPEYLRQYQRLTPRFCDDHSGERLISICEQCSSKFCGKCKDTNGICERSSRDLSHHKIAYVDQHAQRLRDDLKDVRTSAVAKSNMYNTFAQECLQILSEYDTETRTLVSDIHATKEEQVAAVSQKYEALEKRLCDQRNQARNEITQFADCQVEAKQKEINNQIQLIKTTIQDMHEIEVIENHAKRKSNVVKLLTERLPFKKVEKISRFKNGDEQRVIELDLETPEKFTIGTPCANNVTLKYQSILQAEVEWLTGMKDGKPTRMRSASSSSSSSFVSAEGDS